jgi:hypothetical protein
MNLKIVNFLEKKNSLIETSKKKIFFQDLKKVIKHHRKNNQYFKLIDNILNKKFNNLSALDNITFLPTRIFKDYDLISVNKKKIIKKIYSSGTNGKTSKIYLSKENADLQSKVLNYNFSKIIGLKRLPMLIIDKKESITRGFETNARGIAISGFLKFSKNVTFALDSKDNLNIKIVKKFFEKNKNNQIIVFGFTFLIWDKLLKNLIKNKIILNSYDSLLLHGGGWKKLEDQKIHNNKFKKIIKKYLNIKRTHNYYGMVEQAGSIFFECEKSFFHTTIFSDIIIRDNDLKICSFKKKGLVQLLSIIPQSYPGHSILSEDIGKIIGEDDCKCGANGKYFKIYGRLQKSEIRGCSDSGN